MTDLWPEGNPTRFHDGALRLQPIWIVKHGNHFKYCFTRAEMLLFAQAQWYMLYAYVLRAPQDITAANLTGDRLMDRPEWCLNIYRNSTWDVLSTKPLDGIATPIARSFGAATGQLAKAGVKALYLPRPALAGGSHGHRIAQGEPDMFIGYGWLHEATTRHTTSSQVVDVGGPVVHTIGFGLSAGGTPNQWTIADSALGVNRNVLNNANSGFGRELQIAINLFDFNEPPGPSDTGQHNPTQAGTTYGDPIQVPNGLGLTNPLFPDTMEPLIGTGSPLVSFERTEDPAGGSKFAIVCCPLGFQCDRYGVEINRETVYSVTGQTFPTNPIIWPTILFRTELWAAYKGDSRIIRYRSWVDAAIDMTNPLNGDYPQIAPFIICLVNDAVGWFNKGYLYDPALDVIADISAIATLWLPGALRTFEIGTEGLYISGVRQSASPWFTPHASFIVESTADGLAVGLYCFVAPNTDPLHSHTLQVHADMRGPPTPSPTQPGYHFHLQSRCKRRNKEVVPALAGKPDTHPPGLYGPYTYFLVVGDVATVRAKIRGLYATGDLLAP